MRICDWSSDLCSSGLHRLDIQARGERDLIHALLARQVGERLPLGLGQPKLLCPAIEVPSQQARHVVHQEADALVGITHWGSPQSRLINRSEEHTSELQSLMRISYAVFCLKKKTTNLQIQETIQA